MSRTPTLELRFDRYLQPASAVRQSMSLFTGENGVFLEPEYDLIERTLIYRLPAGNRLVSNTQYTVALPVPQEADDDGFRAVDGAPIASGSVPLQYNFFTSRETSEVLPELPVPTCREVLDIFRRGVCTQCHLDTRGGVGNGDCEPGFAPHPVGGDCVQVPRQGLDLSSGPGLVNTALNRVARQTQTGPRGDVPLENPDRFGVQMPVIDPGRPGNSYLMYKLLVNPDNFLEAREPGETRLDVDLPSGELPAGAAERERLREWFVRGDPMPQGGFSMDLADFRSLQAWIQAGAPIDTCN